MILVSACLIGEKCKYNGGDNYSEKLMEFLKGKEYIAICPEVLGGLPTPRTSCEIIRGRVIDQNGVDKTMEYEKGAERALKIALEKGCKLAILQTRSPSCGKGKIYDGTFSKRLIVGDGKTVQLLEKNGIEVINIENL